MDDFKYISELFGSLKEVFRKPVLLMPFLYIFIVMGVFAFFTPNYATPPPGELPPMKDLISMTVLFLAQVLISLIFYGMGLVGMRMHTDGETVTCKNQASNGMKVYGKLLLQKIYLFMIFVLPAIALMLIYTLIQSSRLDVGIIGLLLLLLFVIFVVYIIAMALFYMFSTVIIAYDGKSAKISLRESHNCFRNDMGHVVLTFFSVLLLSVIALVVILLLSILMVLLSENQTVMFFQNLVTLLVLLVLSATVTLYLFRAYVYGNKEMNKELLQSTEANNIVPAAKKETVKVEIIQPPEVVVQKDIKEKTEDEIVAVETPAAKPEDNPAEKLEIKLKPISRPSKPVAKPVAKAASKPAAKSSAKPVAKAAPKQKKK